jgi:hypothetical protein
MKTSNYKIIGITLMAGVLFAAIGFQIFGSGLVSTRPPAPPHIMTTAQGYAVTVTQSTQIVFHTVRLLALASFALLGFACFLRGWPHETNA